MLRGVQRSSPYREAIVGGGVVLVVPCWKTNQANRRRLLLSEVFIQVVYLFRKMSLKHAEPIGHAEYVLGGWRHLFGLLRDSKMINAYLKEPHI